VSALLAPCPPSIAHWPLARARGDCFDIYYCSYIGQDIGDIMLGKVKAQVRSSTRCAAASHRGGLSHFSRTSHPPLCSFVMHSQYALQLVKSMSIGRLKGAGDEEMATLGSTQKHAGPLQLPSAPPLSGILGSSRLPVDLLLSMVYSK
jgi:hypothetical protein